MAKVKRGDFQKVMDAEPVDPPVPGPEPVKAELTIPGATDFMLLGFDSERSVFLGWKVHGQIEAELLGRTLTTLGIDCWARGIAQNIVNRALPAEEKKPDEATPDKPIAISG